MLTKNTVLIKNIVKKNQVGIKLICFSPSFYVVILFRSVPFTEYLREENCFLFFGVSVNEKHFLINFHLFPFVFVLASTPAWVMTTIMENIRQQGDLTQQEKRAVFLTVHDLGCNRELEPKLFN